MPLRLRVLLLVLLFAMPAAAQERADPPGWDRYVAMQRAVRGLGDEGRISEIRWRDGAVHFTRQGRRIALDLATLEQRDITDEAEAAEPADGAAPAAPRRPRVPRGHQQSREPAPVGDLVAVCRDWNVVLENEAGEIVAAVTTDGDRKHRYGRASWVYGEELEQRTAMWWSPDASLLAFYELDERPVMDFHLLERLEEVRSHPVVEGYPKAGEPNPIAALHVYDVASGARTAIDTGPADGIGHYVYRVQFTSDGSALLFHRTSRRQDVLEVVAADPRSGATRVVVRETQPTWQENRPEMRFLDDGRRFIWATERTGWRHYELRDLDGALLATLTHGEHPVQRIAHIDEANGRLFYTAFGGDHPLNAHLHRVNLDGTGQVRLTSERLDHSPDVSPDGRWFICEQQAISSAPRTVLYDGEGDASAVLAEPADDPLAELGTQPAELFTFKADDGETDLYGALYVPSDFDPARRYPLLIDVYGGPTSQSVRQRYRPVEPLCELGLLVARIDNRGTANRGKAFESAAYLSLGDVDLRDQADGVRFLAERPYVDGDRVGIYGHSYGGYMAALALLKHPDVFHVGVAAAAVTDWRHYDTIYTERFMRTPQENPDGYDQGSCALLAANLRGQLLLLHGMVDDNVHPNNAWQLARALQEAERPFEMMFFPDRTHRLGGHAQRMALEFLVEHLVSAGTDVGADKDTDTDVGADKDTDTDVGAAAGGTTSQP